jgi:hypothetical protein
MIVLLLGIFTCLNSINLGAGIHMGCPSGSLRIEKEGRKPLPQSEPKPFISLRVMCEINGHLTPAIIDTGAQVSVMSAHRAKLCGIDHAVDRSISGKVIGAGTTEIVGEIDGLPVRMGPLSFTSRFKILENGGPLDFIIGLDFLRKFKGEVSLKDNMLKLSIRNKIVRIPFLREVTPFDSIDYSGHCETDEGADCPDVISSYESYIEDPALTKKIPKNFNRESKFSTGRLFGKPYIASISGGHSPVRQAAVGEEEFGEADLTQTELNDFDDGDLSMEGV